MSNLKELIEKIKKFRDDRDWLQFHNPDSLAKSIVIEAAELLEHFQWKSKEPFDTAQGLREVEQYVKENKEEISDEIADVAVYLLELADITGIDLVEAIEKKLEKNEQRYPIEKAEGNAKKYTEL